MTITDTQTRRRLTATLFAGNTVSSTSFILAITVASLAAANLTGNPRLAGVPSAAATLGAALGASSLAAVATRWGRRRPFILWFLIAVVGCVIAALSVEHEQFLFLVIAMLITGFGRSVDQMARFAAADMREAEHRGSAIALIVWAATVGSVIGPLLLEPAAASARSFGWTSLAGPYAFSAIGFTITALVLFIFLRPDPLSMAMTEPIDHDLPIAASVSVGELLRRPSVQLALATMLTSQGVMVFVMTMTPVHIEGAGGTLAMVGWVMMAHTLGMFAVSPITGRLVDRIGPRRMIWAGAGVLLIACAIAALADEAQQGILLVSLFLLGLGWNFGFVAGSAQLQVGLTLGERVRLQGVADSATWIAGGTGAITSGLVLSATSYPVLATIGLVASVVPVFFLVRTGK